MNVNKYIKIGLFAAATFLFALISEAQSPVTLYMIQGDSTKNIISLWMTKNPAKGIVTILPPYGGNHTYYGKSKLIPYLLKNDIAFATIYSGPTGYHTDAEIMCLDSMICHLIKNYKIPLDKVILGGFSAGGFGALKYAMLKKSGKIQLGVTPLGLFSVDAPLDLERWYNGLELVLSRVDSTNLMYGEASYLTWMFKDMYKGTPKENRTAYQENSVVSIFEREGGNAKYLKDYPIRLYTEPDINWYIKNVNADYLSLNAIDQAALINILKLAGNKDASLITTTGKGYRAEFNNTRMPHSWSIVDETELGKWIVGLVIKNE